MIRQTACLHNLHPSWTSHSPFALLIALLIIGITITPTLILTLFLWQPTPQPWPWLTVNSIIPILLGTLIFILINSLCHLQDSFQTLQNSLQKARQATQKTEFQLLQILEAMPVGILIMENSGVLFYSNQHAKEILQQEINPEIPFTQFSQTYHFYHPGHPQPYPYQKLPILVALTGKTNKINDIEIRHSHSITPIEMWGIPIKDDKNQLIFVLAVLRDLSEQRQIEGERQRFNQKMIELNRAYERFIPSEFLKLLNKKSIIEVELGDQTEREMTILFSDIRGFTTLSEQMPPQATFDFINLYFGQMEPIIFEYRGVIDKYIGDAIMALFHTPEDALGCAISMLNTLKDYNKLLIHNNYPPIKIGIGLNTGPLMLGTIGGQNRMDSTVIADAVNVAARVEELTKTYDCPLLITEQTFLKLNNLQKHHIRILDHVKVKGKSQFLTVYEVFEADFPESITAKLKTRHAFEQGFMCFHHHNFHKAQQFFEQVLAQYPQDNAAKIYLNRCQQQLNTLPSSATILIVDDTTDNIKLLAECLVPQFKIHIAKSGQAALDSIHIKKPDLILLDIMMPNVGGFEVCQQLKREPWTRNIPIIFITALDNPQEKIKAFQLGAVDYITKPFQAEEVLARINTHLKINWLQKQLQSHNSKLTADNLFLKAKIEARSQTIDTP